MYSYIRSANTPSSMQLSPSTWQTASSRTSRFMVYDAYRKGPEQDWSFFLGYDSLLMALNPSNHYCIGRVLRPKRLYIDPDSRSRIQLNESGKSHSDANAKSQTVAIHGILWKPETDCTTS